MACEVEIQPTAEAELDSIVAYLLAFGENTAKSFLDEWERQLEILQDGKVEHALSRFEALTKLGYRVYFANNYVVLYFRDGHKAVIAHVFHQTQGYASIVLEGI